MVVHTERLAFLPADDRSLKPQETALENLRFWAGLWGAKDMACLDALEKMKIFDLRDRPVKYFSAGQKRRLSLARVFIKKAPLWLLDEPLNGLDRDSYDLFVKAINVHCSLGGMAAIASHYAIEPPKHGMLRRVDLGGAA